MESKNLVICDPETKFASAFAQYLTRQKELAVRVRTCSDLSYVLAIQEKEKIDFLFISSAVIGYVCHLSEHHFLKATSSLLHFTINFASHFLYGLSLSFFKSIFVCIVASSAKINLTFRQKKPQAKKLRANKIRGTT